MSWARCEENNEVDSYYKRLQLSAIYRSCINSQGEGTPLCNVEYLRNNTR